MISQSHASGTEVEEGVTIDLVISKGPEDVVLPDLTGNPKDRVVDKLTALGLNVELIEEYSDTAEGRALNRRVEIRIYSILKDVTSE